MEIRTEKQFGDQVVELLEQHLSSMREQSPPESVHALDLEELKSGNVTFWTCWDDTNLMGGGALKLLDSAHGEIKSMRTSDAYLRHGVASELLRHIVQTAIDLRLKRLSLETGSLDGFAAARNLYHQFGFSMCEPFADYQPDPYSVFMTRYL